MLSQQQCRVHPVGPHFRPVQIEYPKFVHTHSLVVGQVVRQWTANLVFLCDRCLHRALSLFLEWLLAAELGPAEDKSAEFKRRVGEVRQRLLGPGPALRVSWCPRGGGNSLPTHADQTQGASDRPGGEMC